MMWMRSLLFLALQAVLTVVFALAGLLVAPFPFHVRYRVIGGWNHSVLWLARWVCGIRWQLKGMQNLPDGPAIIMAKHQSAWETIALPVLMPPVATVLKQELLKIPFFGWGMSLLDPIALDRNAGRAALKHLEVQGRERLSRGLWVLLFPEGTRVAPGQAGKYNIGGAWLAVRTGTPVVPIAVNAGHCWGRNALLKRPGLITVSVGPVIETAGLKPDAVNQLVQDWIEQEMRRLALAEGQA